MRPGISDTGATEFLANLSVGTVVGVALVLTILRIVLLNLSRTARKSSGQEWGFTRSLAEICESLVVAGILVFLIIRPFFVQAFFIPSESMEPTLLGHDTYNPANGQHRPDSVHDHIFVNKLVFRYDNPHRSDIIVFRAPASADSEDPMNGLPAKENVLIKRCIGVPGDTIEVRNYFDKGQEKCAVFIEKPGEKTFVRQDEYHPKLDGFRYTIKEEMQTYLTSQFKYGTAVSPGGPAAPPGPVHLGPNQYWVMGDNRNDSNDSRYWGPLVRSRVMGKAEVVFWPLFRLRMLH